MKKNNLGISLISLIITIIVIIILAAIVIFSGLGTPDSANLAKFTSEFADFNLAVDNAYMKEVEKNALANQSRSKKQVYYEIATGEDVVETNAGNVNKVPDRTGTVAELETLVGKIYPETLEGEDYYLITKDTNVYNWKKQKQYFEEGEKHYLTDEGEAFFLPGYLVQEDDGSQKWFINESKYYYGTKQTGEGGVTPPPQGDESDGQNPGATEVVLTEKVELAQIGSTQSITTKLSDPGNTKWEIEDNTIVSLDTTSGGSVTVTALNAGVTKVTATSGNQVEEYYVAIGEDVLLISNYNELLAFANTVNEGNTYDGKIVTLINDIDLTGKEWEPIGNYGEGKCFSGVFDGRNHTINGMKPRKYIYPEDGWNRGIGLFSYITNGTIKKINIDNAVIEAYSQVVGAIAAVAEGECNFENITIENTKLENLYYYSGGIVALAQARCKFENITISNTYLVTTRGYAGGISGYVSDKSDFININIDDSSAIYCYDGDFDTGAGGIIGQLDQNCEKVVFENCKVALKLDVYNDITSSYYYGAYRMCGMLIGDTSNYISENGKKIASAPNVIAINCTVAYGNWANYTYCEFRNGGYNVPYVRVQAGYSIPAYYSYRNNSYLTDVNGKEVMDENHVHADGEMHEGTIYEGEIELKFNQLFGGSMSVFGNPTHEGVTVIHNN